MKQFPRIGGRSLAAATFAVVAAGALYLAARPAGYAADKDDAPVKAGASALDFVPADAAAVLSVRVADLWKHPVGKALRDKLTESMPDALKAVRGHLGVGPEEIDRLTAFVPLPGPGTKPPLVAVTTLKPYDQKAVLAAAAPDAKEQKVKERSFYRNDRGPSFAFLDDHTFVMAQPEQLEAFLKQAGDKTEGPLTPVLRLAEKHCVVAGLDVAAVRRSPPPFPDQLPSELVPFKPFFKAQFATLTVDLDAQLKADLKVTFDKEADAKDGAAAVDDGLDMVRGGLVQMMKDLNREDAPKAMALLKDVQAALRAAKAEQKGTTVEVEASLKIDPEATTAALAEGVEKVRKAAKRIEMSNDLKQLALAVQTYHDVNDHLPPAAIADKNGKPLLSWRVALLPYIEQNTLYNEFHLNEPWDSDHNKRLLAKMPTTFAPPDSQAFKDHETHFQALVGKGTVFEGTKSLRFLFDIPDGVSSTILFVEAKKAVPWTKPEDVSLDDGKLLPKLGGLTEGGFLAALCDGSVRMFPLTTKEDALRIRATRNNGQVRPEPEK